MPEVVIIQLLPPKSLLEEEIERIEKQHLNQTNRIARLAEVARTDLTKGVSMEVCISDLRKHFPPSEPRIRGIRSGAAKCRQKCRS